MNKFSFLQTGDWHLSRRFHRFDESIAEPLRRARRDAISECARAALSRKLRHVLVAGDVFDSREVEPRTWEDALTLMSRHADLVWHIIPGNHDFYQRGDMWDAFAAAAPEAVNVYLSPQPLEIEPGVFLLPSPMTSRAQTADPTAWMATAEAPSGALRIGLAHGTIDGTGGEGANAVPIARNAAARARLDYLALGDWHGVFEVNDRTYYAGTPEPLGFKDNGAGFALAVTLDGSAKPDVQRVPTARHAWLAETFSGEPVEALVRLRTRVDGLGSGAHNAVVRLRAEGPLTLEAEAEARRGMSEIGAVVMHAHFDPSGAELGISAAEIDALDVDPALRPVFRRLAERAAGTGSAADKQVANDAVRALQIYGAAALMRSGGA